MPYFFVSALAGAALLASSAAQPETDGSILKTAPPHGLIIEVSGVPSGGGHVRVAICRRQEFLKDCEFSGSAPAVLGVTTIVVPDLPPGTYAAQAYHDRNDNHKVDRNVFGVPTEAVGFSNARIHLKAPSFKAAAFSYSGGDQTISLKLQCFVGAGARRG